MDHLANPVIFSSTRLIFIDHELETSLKDCQYKNNREKVLAKNYQDYQSCFYWAMHLVLELGHEWQANLHELTTILGKK